jgi:hypothetical protein
MGDPTVCEQSLMAHAEANTLLRYAHGQLDPWRICCRCCDELSFGGIGRGIVGGMRYTLRRLVLGVPDFIKISADKFE